MLILKLIIIILNEYIFLSLTLSTYIKSECLLKKTIASNMIFVDNKIIHVCYIKCNI